MEFSDYGAAVQLVAGWIAAETKLQAGVTMFIEPDFPKEPDTVQALFELGGTWREEDNIQTWNLSLVTRAPTLAGVRALALASIRAVYKKFKASKPADRANIKNIYLDALPSLQPRDDRGRLITETKFKMLVYSSGLDEFGFDR